jgi:hypothetical protein
MVINATTATAARDDANIHRGEHVLSMTEMI